MHTDDTETTLFDTVKRNPHDFNAWEQLIQVVDSAVTRALTEAPRRKMDFDSMPEPLRKAIQHAQNTFNDFLARFPYCFGYWKKFAEFEMAYQGENAAKAVYEKSILCFPHSIDLWIQYCSFVSKAESDTDETRQLFERGSVGVGLDFTANPFFDIYLEWEEQQSIIENSYSRTLNLLDRLIRTPMINVTKYYEKYQQIAITRPSTELISQKEYADFKKKVLASFKAIDPKMLDRLKDQQLDDEIKKLVLNDRKLIYERTLQMIKQRTAFEEGIKRPYFHVKPLDEGQLKNWRLYLDFEESQGQPERIIALYERCLVACGLYEEFWIKYCDYLVSIESLERAENSYLRAVYTFIPESRPAALLSYAQFLEYNNRVDEARALLIDSLTKRPGQLQVIIAYAQFERRQSKNDEIEIQYLKSYLQQNLDENSHAFLYSHLSRSLFVLMEDEKAARESFKEGAALYSHDKYYMISYLNFESNFKYDAIQRMKDFFNFLKGSKMPRYEKHNFIKKIYDFLSFAGLEMSIIKKFEYEMQREVKQLEAPKKHVQSDKEVEMSQSKHIKT